jgi:anti-sigma regulatory factor (Ser/Thr protein kinase)
MEKSMDEKMFILIKNHISEISNVSKEFNAFGSQYAIPKNIKNSVDLALDELLNNIISYGYDDQNEHEISIQISFSEKCIIIEIEDDGRNFNPLEVPEVDTRSSLKDRPVGGLGIHMIRNFMDNIEHRYDGTKNYIKMIKNIGGE